MKRAFNLFAIVFLFCFAFALGAFAKYDVIELYGGGGPVEITEPCRMVSGSYLWNEPDGTICFERICTLERDEVTAHALTNFTYSVVTTNTIGVATTNVLTRPHPIPYPDTMTGYWTNTIVSAWSVTNRVPYIALCSTNEVNFSAGYEDTTYLAPGDRLWNDQQATATGKALIFVEK